LKLIIFILKISKALSNSSFESSSAREVALATAVVRPYPKFNIVASSIA